MSINGTGYQSLKTFVATGASPSPVWVVPALDVSGSTLYGTVPDDLNGSGLLFQVNTDGSGYQLLSPLPIGDATLVTDGATLYGSVGGEFDGDEEPPGTDGELFSVSIPEPSAILFDDRGRDVRRTAATPPRAFPCGIEHGQCTANTHPPFLGVALVKGRF